MKKLSIFKKILITFGLLVLVFFVYNFSKSPSLDRNWTQDQQVLANINISGNTVAIENIRDFQYESVDSYSANYINGIYDISQLESLYYIIEPFGSFD